MGWSCWGTRLSAALTIAAALVVASTGAATVLTSEDSSTVTGPWEGCPDRWWGIGGEGNSSNRVCLFAEVDAPEPHALTNVSTDVNPEPCPDGFGGTITYWGDSVVGLCYQVVYELPSRPAVFVGVDVVGCEIPDRQGEDPVIYVADGAVAVCVVPIVEPGDVAPDLELSTEPCEPETMDPEVRFAGGGARVCLDVYLYGYGNPQLNMAVDFAEYALNQTPPYVPTP